MGDYANQGALKWSSAMDHIAERLTTSYGKAENRRRVRDLAEDFILDVLHEVGRSSLGEIAAMVQALEERKLERAARPEAGARHRPQRRPPIGVPRTTGSAPLFERLQSPPGDSTSKGRDPFDITMPSELLEAPVLDIPAPTTPQPGAAQTRREEEPPASVRRFRPDNNERERPQAPPAPPPSEPAVVRTAEEPSPRAPAVALKEGEQVVRASGSGVVIRRVRAV